MPKMFQKCAKLIYFDKIVNGKSRSKTIICRLVMARSLKTQLKGWYFSVNHCLKNVFVESFKPEPPFNVHPERRRIKGRLQ